MLKQKYGPNGTGEGWVTIRSVPFRWAAVEVEVGVGNGNGNGDGDGVLNFSLLYRQL